MNKNKLITFGDSFIAQRSLDPTMETWIDYICKENNLELDGYGAPGNGIWNTVLNFLEYEEDFDVCIFAWSDQSREYFPLRNIRNIRDGQNWNSKNEPSYIKYTAQKLAEIKDISYNDLIVYTSNNFIKLFSLN